MCFPHCDSISFSLCLSVSLHACVTLSVVGSHVVDLGLKLWVITPIMNHHALFRLSSPTGIDCIMKLSFSLNYTLCPHITLLIIRALDTKFDKIRFMLHEIKPHHLGGKMFWRTLEILKDLSLVCLWKAESIITFYTFMAHTDSNMAGFLLTLMSLWLISCLFLTCLERSSYLYVIYRAIYFIEAEKFSKSSKTAKND